MQRQARLCLHHNGREERRKMAVWFYRLAAGCMVEPSSGWLTEVAA
jgi:hypothetical protein